MCVGGAAPWGSQGPRENGSMHSAPSLPLCTPPSRDPGFLADDQRQPVPGPQVMGMACASAAAGAQSPTDESSGFTRGVGTVTRPGASLMRAGRGVMHSSRSPSLVPPRALDVCEVVGKRWPRCQDSEGWSHGCRLREEAGAAGDLPV